MTVKLEEGGKRGGGLEKKKIIGAGRGHMDRRAHEETGFAEEGCDNRKEGRPRKIPA